MIKYRDFALKIEPKQGDVYPVIVLASPAGEARAELHLPFAPDDIGDLLCDMGQTVRRGGTKQWRDTSPGATRTRPQQVGDQLYSALFSGAILALFERSLGMIHGREQGLRIKLHIDPEDESLAQLASLPWEYLYRKETRDFLNLSRFTPIVRYLDVPRPYTPLPLKPPLRILVVIASPERYTPLDLARERRLIEQSWAKMGDVQVDFMDHATISNLHERLSCESYHVLHYMGHGDFDEASGQGVLVLEDEQGQGTMMHGSTLGVLLRDVPSLRLVFLNACETARVAKERGLDPFAGVASALVMAGIPAVVAMQFPISDQAATTFAHKFYALLARGERVDSAVAEGRRAIRLASGHTLEWGTPVLFMRAPEGIIFEVEDESPARVEHEDASPLETPRPDIVPVPVPAEVKGEKDVSKETQPKQAESQKAAAARIESASVAPARPAPKPAAQQYQLAEQTTSSRKGAWRAIGIISVLLIAIAAIAYIFVTQYRPPTPKPGLTTPTRTSSPTQTATPAVEPPSEIDPEGIFLDGKELLHQEKYPEAIAHFDEAQRHGLETAELYFLRAVACTEWADRGGDCPFESAIEDYSHAIEFEAENAEYHHLRAWAFTKLDDLPAAIADWSRAIELDPDNSVYWSERGFRHLELEELQPAFENFVHALDLNPQDSAAYFGLANVNFAQGKFAEAIDNYTKTIDLAPEWPDPYGTRGELYSILNQEANARADYERFLELTQGTPVHQEWQEGIKKWLDDHPR